MNTCRTIVSTTVSTVSAVKLLPLAAPAATSPIAAIEQDMVLSKAESV